MSGPLTIYECPRCGRVSDGEAAGGRCAGAVHDDSAHPVVPMREVRVFREEDVRPLYDACMDDSGHSLAPDAFPAPEEWKWSECGGGHAPGPPGMCAYCAEPEEESMRDTLALQRAKLLEEDGDIRIPNDEPTDDEINNRPGMEGGIPYDSSPDTRDEHDPTL